MHPKCVICEKLFAVGQILDATHCGHVFHHNCLQKWFKKRSTCPDCRGQIDHHPLTRIRLRPDNVSIVTQEEKIRLMEIAGNIKDMTIRKLRELLIGYEQAKKQLAQAVEKENLLKRKLELAENRRQNAEDSRRSTEHHLHRAKRELIRTEKQLKRLRAKKPLVSNAFTQTSTEEASKTLKRLSGTRIQTKPLMDIENIPASLLPKKRQGLSANAIRRKPVCQVADMMLDPELVDLLIESACGADMSVDVGTNF